MRVRPCFFGKAHKDEPSFLFNSLKNICTFTAFSSRFLLTAPPEYVAHEYHGDAHQIRQ